MKKMKRLLALATALILTLSLAACGKKVDTKAMVDAFNATSAIHDETAKLMNDNMDKLDEQTIADYKELSASLSELKTQIENTSITQEQADKVTELLKPMPDQLKAIKAAIETIIAAADVPEEPAPETPTLPEGVTQAQLDALAAALAEIDPLYNEAADLAEQNGWLADDLTSQELAAIAATLDATEAVLADPSMLVGTDPDSVTATLKDLMPMIAPITQRVSVPFEAAPEG